MSAERGSGAARTVTAAVTGESRANEPAAGRLWFGLLGGPSAWAVAFVSTYLVAESTCVRGGALTTAGVIWLAAALVGAAAAVAAWRAQRTVGGAFANGPLREPQARSDEPVGRRFLSAAGIVLSGTFTVVSLVQSLPLFVGVGC